MPDKRARNIFFRVKEAGIRERTVKSVSLLAGCALFLFLQSSAHAISWRYGFQSALEDARKLQKPVMADFYTDWCGWCKKLDKDTYSDQKVKELADKFICVKINGDKYPDLAGKYGVSGYPTVIFFSSAGNVVGNIRGYEGPSDFARNMNAILVKTGASGSAERKAQSPVSKTPAKGVKSQSTRFINQDLIYNGYVEAAGEDLIAQVNYKETTSFIKKGDKFLRHTVASVDKQKIILDNKAGQIVVEYKKPIKVEIPLEAVSTGPEEFIDKGADNEVMSDESGIFKEAGASRISLLFSSLPLAGFVLWFFIVSYIYFIICLQFIAERTIAEYAWMAWLPVVNIFLMCRIGRISYLWILALLIPLINIFVSGFIWHRIAKVRSKSGWIGILIGVPLMPPASLLALGYLALSK